MKALRVEFTLAGNDPSPGVALVLDGDHKPAKRTVVIEHLDAAWNVFALPAFPTTVDPAKVGAKPLTKAAAAWLKKFPPPSGTVLSPVKQEPVAEPGDGKRRTALTLAAVLVAWVAWRNWRARAL